MAPFLVQPIWRDHDYCLRVDVRELLMIAIDNLSLRKEITVDGADQIESISNECVDWKLWGLNGKGRQKTHRFET